ncbi:MAG: primosomal protein N' (replication factor Y) - superfamily II helicase [Paracoccaceae bacterium]
MSAEEHRFPCDSYGADMRYAPQQRELECLHCGNRQSVSHTRTDTVQITEQDYQLAVATSLSEQDVEEIRVLSCANCGAQIEFDAVSHAAECPFCATPVVTDTGSHRQIKPRGVLPFALGESDGRKVMTDWLGSLWFAPSGLQQYARKGRKLEGIYVPYWTFDADTKSSYRGERGTVYHETRTVRRNDKTEQKRVQKIRWRPASGQVARWFDDVLILASKSLPKRFTDGLEPWDMAALEPYQPEYLAGFRAEGYTVEIADGYRQARVLMDRRIQRDAKSDIGGDRQRIHEINTTVSEVTFKHILLPIWLAAYKYRGKTYRFVVNGQSGRVQGERPWSLVKILSAVFALAVIAAAIGFIVATQQQ